VRLALWYGAEDVHHCWTGFELACEVAAGWEAGSSFSPGAFSHRPCRCSVTLPTLRGFPNFCAASEGLLRWLGGRPMCKAPRAAPL